MVSFTLAAFFIFTFCLQLSLGDDPVFPTYSGDIRAAGNILGPEGMPKTRFTFWWSESNRARRMDFKTNEGTERRLVRESEGKYGTRVVMKKKNGETRCTFSSGTAEEPIRYTPFLATSKNRTFLGTTTVDGAVIHTWKFYDQGNGVLYARQDETGLVPVRITFEPNFTMFIEQFSTVFIAPYLFSFNKDDCTENEGPWDQESKNAVTSFFNKEE